MKLHSWALCTALLAGGLLSFPVRASDHADPQSVLNPFKPLDDSAANITDLHAFLADEKGRPILEDVSITGKDAADTAGQRSNEVKARLEKADQLIVSLCVRRRLLPDQIGKLQSKEKLSDYSFRVHLDLNPTMHHFDPARSADAVKKLDDEIKKQAEARDIARKASPPAFGGILSDNEIMAEKALLGLLVKRGALLAQNQAEDLAERLYGGIIDKPEAISDQVLLDFHLDLKPDGVNSETVVVMPKISGIPLRPNVVIEKRLNFDKGEPFIDEAKFAKGAINVQGGIFDDPFIFPRFFRGNVIGIVISIPLDALRKPNGEPVRGQPLLLWGTTHKPDGTISDFVGRSLRTQLPRFGYLNALPPSQHVAEIMRVHANPTLMENGLATFIAPLEAHRHYDAVPDVMVFDLALPAKFPNGRWYADDISKTLADNGETLLLELSCSESRQTPRATTNDKPFRADFPYLAPRWTPLQIKEHSSPGVLFGDFNLINDACQAVPKPVAGATAADTAPKPG
ncbi:MAG: hypothetical protein JWO08_4209, partial [Verrucomicrobiaceae bacterium]|nr:hypothetical protein [Verrucomicrobiaceae bacterium]